MSQSDLPKAYESTSYEDAIYAAWVKSGYFNPDNLPGERKVPFSMVLPPPNATGTLHMGHAVMLVIQDLVARFERMRGKKVLWLPGTDHGGIATNVKVESILQKTEGKSRHDIGREAFIKRVEEFVASSQATIKNQMNKMGSSVDWSREAFTLDEPRNLAVRTMFKKMYDDGLIYRGYRVVNWDPVGQTVISDDELVYKETTAKLYTFKYAKDLPITIASTRPETKVGDTAIAVHPSDERYSQYIGQTFEADFAGTHITVRVIADHTIEKAFGTGALGVTPAHSMADYEMAQKNDLPLIQVIDDQAKMTKAAGPLLEGKSVLDAREVVVEWLKEQGLLEKEEEIAQNLSTAERTGAAVEPIPMLQWFIDVNKPFVFHQSAHAPIVGLQEGQQVSLKEVMRHVVETGQITIVPTTFEKSYFHWIDHLRDWCISRQLWYGHRIPAWYRGEEIFVGTEAPEGEGWQQDPDTLDTWFSSGMWTFSVFGWPNSTPDFELYHPTDLLETGRDILFFWVARMILMTTYALGEVPFKTTYLHGLVRDEQGRKMSKSLENIINPLDMIAKYGADATRLSLMIGITPGQDSKLSEDKVASYRNFTNKLWNIGRFVFGMVGNGGLEESDEMQLAPNTLTLADTWILSRFAYVTQQVTKRLEQYEFSQAAELLRDFTWSEFADWYLEVAKVQLANERTEASTKQVLRMCLRDLLKLWHPFMPYVTEVLWQQCEEGQLMIASWPTFHSDHLQPHLEQDFVFVQEMITAIRNVRSQYRVEPKQHVAVSFLATGAEKMVLEQNHEIIERLARIEKVMFVDQEVSEAATAVVRSTRVFLPLAGLIDLTQEQTRLQKEFDDLEAYIISVSVKLTDEEFLAKAPEKVVMTMKEKQEQARAKRDTIAAQLTSLSAT